MTNTRRATYTITLECDKMNARDLANARDTITWQLRDLGARDVTVSRTTALGPPPKSTVPVTTIRMDEANRLADCLPSAASILKMLEAMASDDLDEVDLMIAIRDTYRTSRGFAGDVYAAQRMDDTMLLASQGCLIAVGEALLQAWDQHALRHDDVPHVGAYALWENHKGTFRMLTRPKQPLVLHQAGTTTRAMPSPPVPLSVHVHAKSEQELIKALDNHQGWVLPQPTKAPPCNYATTTGGPIDMQAAIDRWANTLARNLIEQAGGGDDHDKVSRVVQGIREQVADCARTGEAEKAKALSAALRERGAPMVLRIAASDAYQWHFGGGR